VNDRHRTNVTAGTLAAVLGLVAGGGGGTFASAQAMRELDQRVDALEIAAAVDDNEESHIQADLEELEAGVAANAAALSTIDGKLDRLAQAIELHMAHPNTPTQPAGPSHD
jgi:hypothetical protein